MFNDLIKIKTTRGISAEELSDELANQYNLFELLTPRSQAVSVGIALISTEKKFLPVGSTSNLPLVGDPDGPLQILFPLSAFIKLFFSEG